MKLLKRNSDKAKKKLVLITSEAGLLPLAGAVGLHVAKNLQSKPAIPAGPDTNEIPESLVDEEELEPGDDEPELDSKKPIGELAGVAAVAAAKPDDEDTIDLDNTEDAAASTAGKAAKGAKAKKPKKDKKLKVPNFERFRKWLILGGIALVVLLIGGYFAIVRLPKAKIVISTDSTTLNATVGFTANTTNKTFDEPGKVVPAEMATTKKTDSQTAPATGQKNLGNKASGTVSMTAKKCSGNPFIAPSDVPSGTGLSVNGQTYITQGNAAFHGTGTADGCFTYAADNNISITAQNPGAAANTGSTSFTVAGRSDVSASGSASGGTDNNVKVVTQADVDAAKAKINTGANGDSAKTELSNNLKKDGMYPLTSTMTTDGPNVTTTPKVGDQGDTVSVSSVTTYTMLGVNQANMATVVNNQLKSQIDTSKQSVLDDGLGNATFTVSGKDNPQVSVQTSATIGPNFDTDAIKKEIAGKKKAETIQIISNRPSIKGVTVNYSPFWVTKTPSDPKKVTITFDKANK